MNLLRLKIIVLLGLILTLVVPVSAIAAAPRVTADNALLLDVGTGQIVFAKNHTRRADPASLTKIMTAVVALEYGKLDDVATVSGRAAAVSTGSVIDLRKGEKITLGELLKAALVCSANDSTVAIAEHVGGNHQNFVRMMNAKAAALGLLGTRYVNTNGYHDPNHYTTAYDLAVLARYALGHPRFNELVQTGETTVYWVEPPDREKKLKNSNRLLFSDYEGIDGVKTGTTSYAGNCLVASATRDERRLIAVALHSDDRYQDCIRMFNYGFEVVRPVSIVSANETVFSLKVTGGVNTTAIAVAENELEVRMDPDDLPKLERVIQVPESKSAPVKKGQKLGEAVYILHGQEVGRVNLIAGEDVGRAGWHRQLWDKAFR